MAGASIVVISTGFQSSVERAFEEVRLAGDDYGNNAGNRAADIARELAPVRLGRLRRNIRMVRLVRMSPRRSRGWIEADVREAVPMEFGTYKDRAQPYLRPAMARVGGGGMV